jgi:hypothetical protein
MMVALTFALGYLAVGITTALMTSDIKITVVVTLVHVVANAAMIWVTYAVVDNNNEESQPDEQEPSPLPPSRLRVKACLRQQKARRAVSPANQAGA